MVSRFFEQGQPANLLAKIDALRTGAGPVESEGAHCQEILVLVRLSKKGLHAWLSSYCKSTHWSSAVSQGLIAGHVAPFYYPDALRKNCPIVLGAVGSHPNQMGSKQGRPKDMTYRRVAQQRNARICRPEVPKITTSSTNHYFLRETTMKKMHASSALPNRGLASAWNLPKQVFNRKRTVYQLLILKEINQVIVAKQRAHVCLKSLGPLHDVQRKMSHRKISSRREPGKSTHRQFHWHRFYVM